MPLEIISNPKYQILNLIGQGQFGRVFSAIHRQTGKLVAVKELDQNRFSTKSFLQELSFLVTLQHPHIVSCQGLEYSPQGRYIVMDYCQGGTLRDLIESDNQLDFLQSIQLIRDILLGLEHAHDHGIIHCDLKPENILLETQEKGCKAQIADFGIARFNKDTNSKILSIGDLGSPAYMAPERFYGHYSYASDIYAIGVILFELLVGERPFSGVFRDLRKDHLNQIINIPCEIPFFLRSIINKALQKLPQKRYSSAGEMLASIQIATQILAVS